MKTSIRAVIFDADGMIVHGRRFSDRLANEYGITNEKTSPFFSGAFQDCLVGGADLRESLSAHIAAWGWKSDLDSLLRYWFSEAENHVDETVLAIADALREKGIRVVLATNNEKYRTDDLVNRRGLGVHFDAVFSSSSVGSKKPSPKFFEVIRQELGLERHEIMFWDDDAENVRGAESFGFIARRYSDPDSCKAEVGL
jgi:putative hydrolase of the HAD superfamily